MARHVLLFERRFVEAIKDGQKTHTIRPIRKRTIRAGDQLLLRHWQEKPYRSRQVQFAAVVVTAVRDFYIRLLHPVEIVVDGCLLPLSDAAELARRDGFASPVELHAWHELHYGNDHEKQLIEWKG